MSEESSQGQLDEVLARLSSLSTRPSSLRHLPLRTLCDPVSGLQRLEAWLRATGSPQLQLDAALDQLSGLIRMLRVLSASQPLANSLVQNPGLGSLFFENAIPLEPFQSGHFEEEAVRMIRSSTSQSHLMDRLRFLKQKYLLELTARDLDGAWPQKDIWRWLSELADRLIGLAASSLWERFQIEKGFQMPLPFHVLAMGKLGTWELNYSSDVDLVFISKDGLDYDQKKIAEKFASLLVYTLGEKMGRGSLFRVDLRLRPFGGVGDLAPSAQSFEKYLRNYAQSWELMALTKARVISCGPGDAEPLRLEAWKKQFCYDRIWTEASLIELLEMRQSIDAHAEKEDFKRAAGGIRDVEFVTQIYQLLLAKGFPELQFGSTLELLESLGKHKIISPDTHRLWSKNYTFLRQLEHRCQMLGDKQTHSLPTEEGDLLRVARLCGFEASDHLTHRLEDLLKENQRLYGDTIESGFQLSLDERPSGVDLPLAIKNWLERFPQQESYLDVIEKSPGLRLRVEELEAKAPRFIEQASQSLLMTELVLGGEEDFEACLPPLDVFQQIPVSDLQGEKLAHALRDTIWSRAACWSLDNKYALSQALWEVAVAYVQTLLVRSGLASIEGLSVYALGAFARQEAVVTSDLDLLFLLDDGKLHPEAEACALKLMKIADEATRHSGLLSLDFRLRAEGRQGMIVRTIEGMKRYARTEMEMWERFAIGQAKPIATSKPAQYLIYGLGFGLPLTPDRLQELLEIKGRVESERVEPGLKLRDIKLGSGGLGDIEWLVHLTEMRFPLATHAGDKFKLSERIELLARAQLIHAGELEELQEGLKMLLEMRHWMALQLGGPSIVPENPDKLDRLAHAMKLADGNALLNKHHQTAERLRQIYEDGIQRLKGKAVF